MLTLIVANPRYSSWSQRGWLAMKHSGLPFTAQWVNLYAPDWPTRRAEADIAIADGKVPVLHDGDHVAWNALGIIGWLDQRSGGARFWPADPAARAFALSIAAEMQGGFQLLRQNCPTNFAATWPGWQAPDSIAADVARIDHLWSVAIDRFGGPWLGGAEWGAADILFAPVASRFTTYDIALGPAADAYRQRAMAHPLVLEWLAMARADPVLNPAYEFR